MPTRSPEEERRPVSPWRFPHLNPHHRLFRERLARLGAGEKVAIPLGHFLTYSWGVTVGQEAGWPPAAPITARDSGLSARIGPLEVAVSGKSLGLTVHLPGTAGQGAEGASLTVGSRLRWETQWAGLNTLTTLWYETAWRSTLPAAGEVLPSDALPASNGSVGVYATVYSVRTLLFLGIAVAAGYAGYWLLGTAPQPVLQPGVP